MPDVQHDPDDSQPFAGPPDRKHRVYIHAEWAKPGMGGGHPKLSGGVTIDPRDGSPAPRGWNRADARYTQPLSTILANREARGVTDGAESVVLQGALSLYEVRGPSGNNYDVSGSLLTCDCPDWWRLEESGYGIVRCKHIYAVMRALASPSNVLAYGLSCSYVAELIGCDERTVEQLCADGVITAIKVHQVWVIDPVAAPPQAAVYKSRIVTFPNATGGPIET